MCKTRVHLHKMTMVCIKQLTVAMFHPLMHFVWLFYVAAAAAVISVLAAFLQVEGQAVWLLNDS